MIVQDTLAKDYSGSFKYSFDQDLDSSRSYLSIGTVICAKIVQLLANSLMMSTLSATAAMIQQSIHFGRLDALLPIHPHTGQPENLYRHPVNKRSKSKPCSKQPFSALFRNPTNHSTLNKVPSLIPNGDSNCEISTVASDIPLGKYVILRLKRLK